MPTPYRLPNGSVINISDDPALQREQFRAIGIVYGLNREEFLSGFNYPQPTPYGYQVPQPDTGLTPQPQEPEEPDIGFTDSRRLMSGIQQGLYGILDIPASAATAIASVLTPGGDTKLERDLRRAEEIYMAASDPEAASLYTSQLARGLGQAGGLTALAFVPVVGAPLAIGAGVGLGISEAARRIRNYEETTRADIPWYKETVAHGAGAVLGLAESILPARLASRIRRTGKTKRSFSQIVGESLGGAATEGLQEGLAYVGQAATARGLYDKNALDNIFYAASEDAKVGAGVGLISNAIVASLGGRVGGSGSFMDRSAESEAERQASFLDANRELQREFLPSGYEQLAQNFGLDAEQANQIVTRLTEGQQGHSTQFLANARSLNASALSNLITEMSSNAEALASSLEEGGDTAGAQFAREYQNRRTLGIQQALTALRENFGVSSTAYDEALRSAQNADLDSNLDIRAAIQNSLTGQSAAGVDAKSNFGILAPERNAEGQLVPQRLSDRNLISSGDLGAIVDYTLSIDKSGATEISRLEQEIQQAADDIAMLDATQATEGQSAERSAIRNRANLAQRTKRLSQDVIRTENLNRFLTQQRTQEEIAEAAGRAGLSTEQYTRWLNNMVARISNRAEAIEKRRRALEAAVRSNAPAEVLQVIGNDYRLAEAERAFDPIDILRISALDSKSTIDESVSNGMAARAMASLSATLTDANTPMVNAGGNASNKRLATAIKTFLDTKRTPTEADIVNILAAKNLKLRDEKIRAGGAALGVESPAFKKLVQSLTGARSWKDASTGQKWLVYARLAEMTPNYGFVRRGKFYSRGSLDARQTAYLSDFMDGYDPITEEIQDNDPLYREILTALPEGNTDLAQVMRDMRNMEQAEWGADKGRVEEAFTRLAEAGFIEFDGENVRPVVSELELLERGEIDEEGFSVGPVIDEAKTREALEGRDDLITILRSAHNQRNPDNIFDNNEDFIDEYWEEIAAYSVVSDLTPQSQQEVDREFINSVVQGNISLITESLNENNGNLGEDVLAQLQLALRYAQAIPVDVTNSLQLQKQQHYDTVQNAVQKIKDQFERSIGNLGLSGQVKLDLVSSIDDWASVLSDVFSISNPSILGKDAVYNNETGRLILNLSRLDPRIIFEGDFDSFESASKDKKSLEAIIDEAANEAGLSLIATQYLKDGDLKLLSNYAKRAKVPEGTETYGLDSPTYRVLAEAENKGLTEATLDKIAAAMVLKDASSGVIKKPQITAPVKIVRDIYRSLSGAVLSEPDIIDVFRVFDQINSGAVADRGRPPVDKNFVENSEYLRFATGDQLNELRKLYKEKGELESESLVRETDEKIKKVLDEVLDQRDQMLDQAPPDLDLSQAVQLRNQQIAAFRDDAPTNRSVLGPQKDLLVSGQQGEANRAAADEGMKALDGRDPYKMPPALKGIFLQQHRISSRTKRLVEDAERRRITPTEKELPGEQYVRSDQSFFERKGKLLDALSFHKTREMLLDRSVPLQILDQFLAGNSEAGPLMERERGSALAYLATLRDNARAFSSGMFGIGPMAYLDGQFGSRPYYDEKLGRYVGGFKELIRLVNTDADQKAAYLYGISKRIRSLEGFLESQQQAIDSYRASGVSDASLKGLTDERDRTQKALDASKQVKVTDKDGKTVSTNFGNPQFIDDIIQSVEADENNAHIVKFWDLYQAMNRGYLTLARDTGLLSQKDYETLINLEYVPFYEGLMTDTDESNNPISPVLNSRALSGLSVLDPALTGGSQVNAHELIANLNSNMQSLVAQSIQNVLAKKTADDLVSMKLADEAVSLPRNAAELEKQGRLQGQYLVFKEDGQRRIVKISDEDSQTDLSRVVRAVMTAQINPVKTVQDFFGNFLPEGVAKFASDATFGTSQLLRETVTRMPAFPIRNLFRDSLSASTTLGDPGIFFSAISKAFDPATSQQAARVGVRQPIDMVTSDPDYYRSKVNVDKGRETLDDMGLRGKDLVNPFNAVKATWNTLGRITDNAEAATRMAVYERVLAKTGSHQAAIEQAIDVLNYGKRGTSGVSRVILATIPFASGRLQGLDVTYRALRPFDRFRKIKGRDTGVRRPGAQRFGVTESEYAAKPMLQKQKEAYIFGLMALAGLSGMYELFMRMNDEDEEYAGLDERLRRENYLIPWSKHVWLRLPVPFEVGLITKTIPQTIAESIFLEQYDAKDAVAGTADAVQRTLSLGSPQVVAPFFDLWLNKDAFFKGEIIPELTRQLSPRYQYTTGTSDTARLIARAAEKSGLGAASRLLPGDYSFSSPMVMEYLLTKYFGTMGLYGITMTDALMRNQQLPFYDVADKLIDVRSPVGSRADFMRLEAALGGDGVTRMPVMASLLTDPRRRQGVLNEFYELDRQLNTAIRDLNSAKEEAGNRDEYLRNAYEATDANRTLFAYRATINAYKNQIQAINRRMAEVLVSDVYNDTEKRSEYNRLMRERARIAGLSVEIVANVKKNKRLWGLISGERDD
jgi:hypothetical protein